MTITKFKPSNHLLREALSPIGFDNFVSNFFNESGETPTATSYFKPTVDVVEHDHNFDIYVSIPGVKKEDIVLDVKGNELIVSGERHQRTATKDATHHIGEIRYGKFSRTFFLPEQVDKEKIEAIFSDGMLNISIPKVEKAKPRAIQIK